MKKGIIFGSILVLIGYITMLMNGFDIQIMSSSDPAAAWAGALVAGFGALSIIASLVTRRNWFFSE
ncbi:MAG: hypothetical protein ACOC32_04125 [Nanoarchaeota archaeon]